MVKSIAYYEIICMKSHVVAHYLVEYSLSYLYVGCFILNNDAGRPFSREHYSVATLACTVDLYAYFVGHERSFEAMKQSAVLPTLQV